MEIQAKCKYDFEAIKALTYVMLYGKENPKKRCLFWLIFAGILFVVALVDIVIFDSGFRLLILAIVVFTLQCYFYFAFPKRINKGMAKLQGAEFQFTFYDNLLEVIMKGEGYDGQTRVEYSVLVKAYETSAYFFLFLPNTQAYIIDKSTVVGGSAEDIRNKLGSSLGKRYYLFEY